MKNRGFYQNRRNHPNGLKNFSLSILTSLSLTACFQTELQTELLSPPTISSKQMTLAASDNCNELQRYLTNALLENYTKQNDYGYQRGPFPPAATGGAESDAINTSLPPLAEILPPVLKCPPIFPGDT